MPKPARNDKLKDARPGRWPLAVAKSRLSEIVRKAQEEGPQVLTSHGQDVAKIVPTRTRGVRYTPTGTGYDFVLASIPYRGLAEGIEFDTSFEAAEECPIDLP